MVRLLGPEGQTCTCHCNRCSKNKNHCHNKKKGCHM